MIREQNHRTSHQIFQNTGQIGCRRAHPIDRRQIHRARRLERDSPTERQFVPVAEATGGKFAVEPQAPLNSVTMASANGRSALVAPTPSAGARTRRDSRRARRRSPPSTSTAGPPSSTPIWQVAARRRVAVSPGSYAPRRESSGQREGLPAATQNKRAARLSRAARGSSAYE